MPSLYIGWEDGNMLLNGADDYVKVNVPIVITGYQISASSLPFANMGTMVLMQLAALPAVPSASPPANYIGTTPNPDFSANAAVNPSNSQLGGGIGGGGIFASIILKGASGAAANQSFCISGLDIPVAAGWYIVAHIDGGGSTRSTTDGEIQGCIYYTYPP